MLLCSGQLNSAYNWEKKILCHHRLKTFSWPLLSWSRMLVLIGPTCWTDQQLPWWLVPIATRKKLDSLASSRRQSHTYKQSTNLCLNSPQSLEAILILLSALYESKVKSKNKFKTNHWKRNKQIISQNNKAQSWLNWIFYVQYSGLWCFGGCWQFLAIKY